MTDPMAAEGQSTGRTYVGSLLGEGKKGGKKERWEGEERKRERDREKER